MSTTTSIIKQPKAHSRDLTKQQIRNKILTRLRKQKEEEGLRKSREILKKLFRLDRIKKAKVIMLYLAFNGEVKTDEIINKMLKLGKTVVVPVCSTKECKITPCKIGLNERLSKGPYGIYQPHKKTSVPLSKLDVVIVPGVAFDKKGGRLGRGKGYYDRFLMRLTKKTYCIGLAFDFQILPSIPLSSHDIHVDKVIFA